MTLAVSAIVVYAALGILSAVMVLRARRRPAATDPAELPRASIIVAARNEESQIGACIDALAAQNYPEELIEILIIDDDSTDQTRTVIDAKVADDVRFFVVGAEALAGHPPGKAAALHTGIERASGELLLFTDADCRPPVSWARAMVTEMREAELGALGGLTRVSGSGLRARLQAVDWTLLKGVASGWSLAGIPLTAMGNNMAVSREAYNDIGGFPTLKPSVTEDYALFKAIGDAGWKIRLDPHPSLENKTAAEPRLRDVFRQRRRWASGALTASPIAFAFYVAIFAAHLLPVLLLPTNLQPALIMIGCKVVVDALVLSVSSARGRTLFNLGVWPVYEVWLYAYVLALPITLAVVPEIIWKERPFRHVDAGGSRT